MIEHYSFDPKSKKLTRYITSDDGRNQEVREFIDKKEYDDLAKQLEYANRKIENRDELIKELRQEPDKTKALKGTIRGLEKTRDKLQARVNSLAKKLIKAEARVDIGKLKIETLLRENDYWYQECLKAKGLK